MKNVEEYTERHKEYYKNLPLWNEFTIFDSSVDGLIPSCRVDSLEGFDQVVKHFCQPGNDQDFVFRGQQHYEWLLAPTLDRLTKSAIDEELAKKQLRNFKLSIRGRVADNTVFNDNDEELWAIGQHHGLATPLLDWSVSPYVSLFFAFMHEDSETWVDKDGEPNNYSRVIYVLNRAFISDLEEDEADPIFEGHPKIVEPAKDDHGRLVNQAGLFSLAPYGETLESSLLKALQDSDVDTNSPNELANYICRIHIPNSIEMRIECLRRLRKMNIHHASLFPDLIGASGFCNDLLKEHIYRVDLEAKQLESIATPINPTIVRQDISTKVTGKPVADLVNAILSTHLLSKHIKESDIKNISHHTLDFIENKAGVDWMKRDSQVARLKNILRRKLKKIKFPEADVSEATDTLVDLAITLERDKQK